MKFVKQIKTIKTKLIAYLIKKKKMVIIVAVILLIILGGIASSKYKQHQAQILADQNMMYEVPVGDISVQVKVTATANLVNEQNLSFAQEGKITSVYTRVGDEVKAGDILAELNMSNYHNAIQTAELEVANAELGLQKLINNDTSLLEAQIRSQLKEAQASYNLEIEQSKLLPRQLESIMQQKNDQLDQRVREYLIAKEELEIAGLGEDNKDRARQQKINSITSDLQSILGDAEHHIESIDKIFGASNLFRSQSSPYSIYISSKDLALKQAVIANILKSYLLIRTYQDNVGALSAAISDSQIHTLITNLYDESILLVETCDDAINALDMSVIGTTLTESILLGYTTTAKTARTVLISLRSQLQALKNSLDTILLSYDKQLIALQKKEEGIRLLAGEIETLEKDQINQINRQQIQIDILKEKISLLGQELRNVLDGADSYDLQHQRNLISQAKLRLERSRDQEDDYQIVAEFDGRVRTVDIVEGEQYKLDDRNFIVVENPNLIELKLQVSQIDIVKIAEGDPVVVTFDAHPNNPIQANITSRNVNPEPNSRGGIYYEAIILLEKQELEILAGMSALVTITTAEKGNVIIIPTLSLVQEKNIYFVYLKNGDEYGNEYKKHEVKVGLMNNFQAEILEGLNEGDIIKSSVLDEDALHEMGIDDSNAAIF